MMKSNVLRTLWIIGLSVFYTINTCLQALFMHFIGRSNRAWVDKSIHLWINRLLNAVGASCKIYNPYGVKPVAGRATIVMCNHTSIYDIPLSFKVFPHHSMRMLAKKELSRIPILGRGMASAEFPFIDRKNRHQAQKDLEYAQELMESGILIWVAPEGTRSKDGKLAAFKKGAFVTAIKAQALIIPIGIRGAFDILPAKTMSFNCNQTAEIHIGKPIDASEYNLENKELLIDKVHQAIKELIEPAA